MESKGLHNPFGYIYIYIYIYIEREREGERERDKIYDMWQEMVYNIIIIQVPKTKLQLVINLPRIAMENEHA